MVAVELAHGTLIGGRYRLDRLLGEGGMGAVWAVDDLVDGGRCALKLMKDPAGDPEGRKRFLREGRAASAVRHPNVVGILDVLEPDGEPPAIAMELLEGASLRELLDRKHQLPLAELAEIMVPVISAVGAAHACGIVHRDLKPENIFLVEGAGGERTVKVLDFGIVKLTALDGEAKRSTGITTDVLIGTPAYMAPEQVFAERDLDHRADIWALGVIVYECLSGVCPTQGDSVGQIIKHVVSRPFKPLRDLVPDVPEELSHLIARMLSRDPSQRPADLHEVLDVLEPFAAAPGIRFGVPAPRALRAEEVAATLPSASMHDHRAGAVDARARTVRQISRPRRRVALASAASVALLGAVAAWIGWPAPAGTAASPLAAAGAKLACPVLRVSGVTQPNGWLGAAAAAVICERARLILGGRPERMLVPAELLDLPGEPIDAFPADRYGQPDARERSLITARQRAQAYLDGDVGWSAMEFTVDLALHGADGRELARAGGRGRGLYDAVRSAMAPLVNQGALPKARALEPAIAAWSRTSSVDDALAVVDLTFAFAHNAGDLPRECERFEAVSPRVHELGFEGRWLCAYILGREPPALTLDSSDRSTAGIATRIRVTHGIDKTSDPGDLARVHAAFEREPTARGRSLLAAIESCLLDPSKEQAARELAITAVQRDPKNTEGGRCNPWEQLISLDRTTNAARGTWGAMQAWMPWNSYAWLEAGFGSGGKGATALPGLRRAYLLSPFDTQIARELAGSYLASGDRTAVRGIAVALRRGGLALHDVESTLLLIRADISEVQFRTAIERARAAAAILPTDAGWVRTQRFEIAWRALEAAVLVGRDREVADWLVARFLDPRSPALDIHSAVVPMRIPAVCVHASMPDRCFERFRALRQQLSGTATQHMEDLLVGAERYAKHDLVGAARAWRPLLAAGMELVSALPDAMVDAFEHEGARDLVERIDEEVMKRAGEFNDATLGHVRTARRALARGDRRLARQLADQVIKAWSLADEEPPVLAEMRKIAASP